MKMNYSEEFESKFSYENNNIYDFNEMLKKVLVFIHHGHGLTLEEIRDNIYMQHVIYFAMSMNWRKDMYNLTLLRCSLSFLNM